MRRSDREITDASEITAIMEKCEVLRLALHNEPAPYLLPVNFGMEPDGQTMYIHGALEGTKYTLLAADNRAGFEMDCTQGLVLDEKGHSCTMNYESVIGWGEITEITDETEKLYALKRIMAHYHKEDFPFNTGPVRVTRVLKLRVCERTAKRRKKLV